MQTMHRGSYFRSIISALIFFIISYSLQTATQHVVIIFKTLNGLGACSLGDFSLNYPEDLNLPFLDTSAIIPASGITYRSRSIIMDFMSVSNSTKAFLHSFAASIHLSAHFLSVCPCLSPISFSPVTFSYCLSLSSFFFNFFCSQWNEGL